MVSRLKNAALASLVLILTLLWQTNLMSQGTGAVLSVELSHARIRRSSVSFEWRLVNGSKEPIYVYSTFMEGPAALEPSNQSGILKVRTSLSAREPVGVNAYPAAKFLRIEPAGTVSGRFSESRLSRRELHGVDSVEMEVGYGTQIKELKRQIQATSRNGDHPANPIVVWQTMAFGKAKVGK